MLGDHRRSRCVINRYHLRIDASFDGIKKWTNLASAADINWRIYSPEDILQICDYRTIRASPTLPLRNRFSTGFSVIAGDWKLNAMIFTYKAEDWEGVDLTQKLEQNRGRPNDSHNAQV